ncbi:MAG: caspase family protein [Thermoplasmata archaeon]|nr:caspase family protein [Thermoplasmata archaeon]
MRVSGRAPKITGALLMTVCVMVLAIAPSQSAGSVHEELKFALLVGVSDYDPVCTYGDLKYSHKDAIDMYDLLVNENGWNPSNVILLYNESATAENILDGISWLSAMCNSCPRSTALIFFSGHGSFFCDNKAVRNWDEPVDECIVPHDGDSQWIQNIIFDDVMREQLSSFGSARTILILDACYSGGFIEDVGAEGRLILTSCGEREMCWEGVETGKVRIQNGVFTYCLLEAFRGAGDMDGDGKVSVEEAGSYAMDRVRDFTPDVQPEMFDGVKGEAYI